MSALLAIDTSTQLCSAAILLHDEIVEEVVDISRGHTQHILPLIDRLLSACGITLNTLDAIALTAGPGSFTGLRIGMGVAQGLAFGADLPVVPVSTLQTLAQGAIRTEGAEREQWILPMLDARMGDVYWGLYNQEAEISDDGITQPISRELIPDQVNQPVAVLENLNQMLKQMLPSGIDGVEQLALALGVGDGWRFGNELGFKVKVFDTDARSVARDIIPLALEKLSAGKLTDPSALEPFYIRDKIHWQKRKRLR